MRLRVFADLLLVAVVAICVAGCGSGGDGGSKMAPPPEQDAATPTISPAAGTYMAAQTVTLADATAGATIYYTTDGTVPTNGSSVYKKAIAVPSTATIKAIARADGYLASGIASATFTITIVLPVASGPTFSPAPGIYTGTQAVTLTDATAGATIYYTTDGTIPTTSSTVYTAPIQVVRNETISAIAVAPGFANSGVATGAYQISGPAVAVVLSTHDRTQLLAAQPGMQFTSTSVVPAGSNPVIVDETETYQPIEGFGASFTDSTGYLLTQKVSVSDLPGVMSDLFTRTGGGIGLSFMRIPMGASDLARSVYSFDDEPAGTSDSTLKDFSISHDQDVILPLVVQAKALNPSLKLMANPWSPPGWMKSTDSMLGGTLLTTAQAPFADYFVKYLQAYQAAGVTVDYISLQNEPLYVTTAYPSMGMDAATQLGLLRDVVLPALSAAKLPTRVFVYDHNWDQPGYPETVLGDATILASDQVAGTAWHGYGGTPGAQQTVANSFPTKGTWETEHSGGTFVSDQFSSDFVEITQVMRNASRSYVKWSLALDENNGPNLTELGGGLGGCSTCTPIVTVNSSNGAVSKAIEYYTLGQYSKYVLPGAVRIYSSNSGRIATVGFKNPDGSKALVVFNSAGSSQTVAVEWGAQSFAYTLPAEAAATFTWAGAQQGAATMAATSQIEASSYSTVSGFQTETITDTTGVYDLGYAVPGGYATFTNVDFGSGVSGVTVREASGGNGGTLEFHLDSATGPLVATVALPVTGGYQSWENQTATASGATGVHTVYLVIRGSGGIANVNWFQFQ